VGKKTPGKKVPRWPFPVVPAGAAQISSALFFFSLLSPFSAGCFCEGERWAGVWDQRTGGPFGGLHSVGVFHKRPRGAAGGGGAGGGGGRDFFFSPFEESVPTSPRMATRGGAPGPKNRGDGPRGGAGRKGGRPGPRVKKNPLSARKGGGDPGAPPLGHEIFPGEEGISGHTAHGAQGPLRGGPPAPSAGRFPGPGGRPNHQGGGGGKGAGKGARPSVKGFGGRSGEGNKAHG